MICRRYGVSPSQAIRNARSVFDLQFDYAVAANAMEKQTEDGLNALREIQRSLGHKPQADVVTAAVIKCLLVQTHLK